MKMRWSLILIAAVAGAALAAVPQNAGPDGLVQVQSRTLDEVYMRPSADSARLSQGSWSTRQGPNCRRAGSST